MLVPIGGPESFCLLNDEVDVCLCVCEVRTLGECLNEMKVCADTNMCTRGNTKACVHTTHMDTCIQTYINVDVLHHNYNIDVHTTQKQ